MSVIIRLQGLPWSSSAADIRQYFKGLSIPPGGVHIIGGDKGDAFIAFASDEDARQAMMLNSGFIENSQVQLFLSSKSQMQTVIAEARGQSSQPEEQTIQPPVEPTSVQSYMPGYPPPVRSQDPFQQPGSSPFPGVPVSQPNYPPSKPPLLQPPTTKTPEKPATTVPDYTPQSVEHGYGYPRHNDTTGYNRNMEYDRQQWPPKQFNPEVPPPKPNAESDHYEATFGKDHFGRYYPPKNENEMSGPPPFKEFDRRQPYQEGVVRAPGQFPTGSDNDPRGEKPYGRQGDVGGIRDNTLPPEGEPRRRSRFNERGDDINIQAPDDRYGQSMEHTGTSASRYGEGIRPYDHSQDISRQHQPPVDAKSDAHAAPDPYPDPKMHQRSSFDPRFGHDQSQRQFDRPPLDRPLLDRPPVSENRPLLDRPQGQRFEKQPADYPEMETNQGRSFEQPYHRQQTDHDQGSRFRDVPAPTDPNMPRFDRPPPRGRPPYHEQRFGDGQPERHGSNERVAPEDAWGQDSHYGEHRPREERFDDRPKEENERFRGPPRNEIPPSFEPRFQRPGFREPNPEFRPRGAFPPPRGVMDHWGPRPLRPGPPSREMGLPRYGGPPDQDRRHPGSGDKPHEVPMDHDSRLRPPRFGAPGGPPPRHRFGPDGAQRQNVNNSDADMRDQPGRDREGESRRPVSDVDSRSRRDDDRRERDRSFSRDRDRERDRDRDRDRERDRERDRDRDRDSRNRDFDRSDRRSREDRERDRDRRDYSRDSRGRDDFRDSRSRGTDRFGRERREDRDQRIEKSPLSHQKAPDVESRAASYGGKDQTKQVGILGEAPPGMMPFHLQKQGGNEGANSFNKRESYRPSSQGEPAQRDVDSRGVKRPHQEPPKHDNTVVAKNLIENVTYRDIRTFFSGCEIPWDGLKVINDNQGRRIGVAYIKFMNQRSFWEGLNKHGKSMGDNRVEVLKCPIEEFDTAIDSYAPGKTPPDAIKRARMDESATQQRNSPAVKEKYSQYIVQVKGLGINVKGEDMISFFDDCKIAKSGKGSHIEYDMKRRATGVGFVEMETQHDHQKALAHDGKSLNCRIIRVSSATIRDIDQLYERMKEMEKLEGGVQMNGKDKTEGGNKQLDVKQGRIESGGGDTGSSFGHSCIQLQDLPPMVTVKDIGQFFGGIEVAPRGIQIVQDSNGRSLGEAFVEFSSVSECEKALKFDQHPLGNKNVSIKPISKSEMSDYIRQMRPPSRAPQHGPPPAMHGHPPPGMLPPPHGPPPPQGMFYGRRFLVKVQGLPFTISVGEVLNFLRGFNPIPESVRVMVGNDPAGTSAIVGFRSIEDAEAVIRELDNTFYRNMQVHLSPCPS